MSSPHSVYSGTKSNLTDVTNQADYLVIAPEILADGAARLAAYRQSRGLNVLVADLEQIYDAFNFGIADPRAIKDFLAFAYYSWSRPPSYVALLGEGTYDYRDLLGYGGTVMPPLMAATPYGVFASDNSLADISGNDGIPEIAIGRIPAVGNDELNAVIDKIEIYESSSGDWKNRILMLADNPDSGGDFTASSDAVAALISPVYPVEKIYLEELSSSVARQRLLNRINVGTGWVNYIGHAAFNGLAAEGLLKPQDISLMTNADLPSFITAFTCSAGDFAVPGFDSIGEIVLLAPDKGVVGFIGPTGLSLNDQAQLLNERLFDLIFNSGEAVLGDAMRKALAEFVKSGGTRDLANIYTVLADPALMLR
jgi:hypothetical protein